MLEGGGGRGGLLAGSVARCMVVENKTCVCFDVVGDVFACIFSLKNLRNSSNWKLFDLVWRGWTSGWLTLKSSKLRSNFKKRSKGMMWWKRNSTCFGFIEVFFSRISGCEHQPVWKWAASPSGWRLEGNDLVWRNETREVLRRSDGISLLNITQPVGRLKKRNRFVFGVIEPMNQPDWWVQTQKQANFSWSPFMWDVLSLRNP